MCVFDYVNQGPRQLERPTMESESPSVASATSLCIYKCLSNVIFQRISKFPEGHSFKSERRPLVLKIFSRGHVFYHAIALFPHIIIY